MSGTPNVRTPRNDAEWARNTERRIQQVENPTSVRVGQWVLSTSPGGALIASNVGGGSQVLAVPAVGDEVDPDSVRDQDRMTFKARRINVQTMPQDVVTPVVWDAVDWAVGDWGGLTSDTFSSVSVPVDGKYLVVGKLVWVDSNDLARRSVLSVNGTSVDTHVVFPYNNLADSNRNVEVLDLFAGDAIALSGWPDSDLDIGAAASDLNSFPSLSIVYLG